MSTMTMREKFEKWYESDRGKEEITHGMHFSGWAYEAFAAGYRACALDLLAGTPYADSDLKK